MPIPDGIAPSVIINNFMVCKAHGEEWCGRCTCDHRFANNAAEGLDDELGELIEETGFSLDDRQSRNAYNLGAVPVKRGSEDYKCTTHNKQDCGTCFDWKKIIEQEILEEQRTEKWLQKRKKYHDRVDRD